MRRVKIVTGIFCCILFISLSYYFISLQKPNMNNISRHLEMGKDNTFYIAENKKYSNVIYKIDETGQILNVFKRSNSFFKKKEMITDLCYDQDLYFLVEREKGNNAEEYEIFRIEKNWENAQSLGTLEKETTFMVSNFTVKDNMLFITGIDKALGDQIVYSFDISNKDSDFEIELFQKYPLKENGTMADVVENYYDGTNLYSLTEKGMLYRYDKNSSFAKYMDELNTISWILDSQTGVICYSQDNKSILHVNQDIIRNINQDPYSGLIDMTISLTSGNQAIIYRDNDYNKNIIFVMEHNQFKIENFYYEIKIMLKLYSKIIFNIATLVIGFYIVFIFLFFFFKKMRKTALKLAILTFLLNLLFITIVCIWNYVNSRNLLYDSRAVSTKVYLAEEMQRLAEKFRINEINFENITQSQWFDLVDNELWDWAIPDFDGNHILFQLEIVKLSEDGGKILISEQHAVGRNVLGIYSKEILKYINFNEDVGFFKRLKTSFQDREYMYVLLKLDKNYMCIGRADIRDIPERTNSIWFKSVQFGVLFGGIISILFLILIFRLLKPLKRMSKAMGKVTQGIYDLEAQVYPNNEFGDMWKYLHKMCTSLRTRKYSSDNVLSYYQRFAPNDFENLLDVESIQDVRIGAQNSVAGSIAMISIMDVKQLKNSKEQVSYLQTVNKMIKSMSKHYNDKNDRFKKSYLLCDKYQLTDYRKLFVGDNCVDLVYQFAVDLLHDLYGLKETFEYITPSIILHKDNFICGLSGTDSIVYPYVISESTEEFCELIQHFKNLQIRLVITEQILEQLSKKPNIRLIGEQTNQNIKYKLYEVLSLCPKNEMLLKEKNNIIFQKGLELYCHNYFYEARSCFAEMIKSCPMDGVAKWYLMACDFYVENKILEINSHDLFQIENYK